MHRVLEYVLPNIHSLRQTLMSTYCLCKMEHKRWKAVCEMRSLPLALNVTL